MPQKNKKGIRIPIDGQTKEKEAEGSQAMIGILIALISGALMSIQGVFNTEVTKQTSIWVSSGVGAADRFF